ncbi:MAG: formimidoylglutamate deiminase [Burkholderiaceae bacterium]
MIATFDPNRALFAAHALLPDGWANDVLLAWDETGCLTDVRSVGAAAVSTLPHVAGPLIAGMPNLHSHAFQRAFAGLSEYRSAGSGNDSFWTWRDLMYRFARTLSPEQLEDIATQLYVEMLQAGYTSVCEFHYLHHDVSGQPYGDPAEMSMRLLAAAQRAGIGITLLPVLYQNSGFDALPPRADQQRFINSVDGLLRIVERLRAQGARVGVAPHSLRAVAPAALNELLSGLNAIDPTAPIHIHIAEQAQEVQDCVAWSGQRPVQWLLDHAAVDARWCLVHATHMNAAETHAAAANGATVGVCPSTEANLGDGVFDAVGWAAANGHWGIGSDSHAGVDAAEELRLLEYAQRLTRQQRNVLASARHPQIADQLWLASASGGARASGRPVGALAVGAQADFVVLDTSQALAGLSPSQVLANHVFASHGRNTVRDVWVAGQQRIIKGEHALEGPACERFVAARSQLLREV